MAYLIKVVKLLPAVLAVARLELFFNHLLLALLLLGGLTPLISLIRRVLNDARHWFGSLSLCCPRSCGLIPVDSSTDIVKVRRWHAIDRGSILLQQFALKLLILL